MNSEIESVAFKAKLDTLALSPNSNELVLSACDYQLRILDVREAQMGKLNFQVRPECLLSLLSLLSLFSLPFVLFLLILFSDFLLGPQLLLSIVVVNLLC